MVPWPWSNLPDRSSPEPAPCHCCRNSQPGANLGALRASRATCPENFLEAALAEELFSCLFQFNFGLKYQITQFPAVQFYSFFWLF